MQFMDEDLSGSKLSRVATTCGSCNEAMVSVKGRKLLAAQQLSSQESICSVVLVTKN
jgi:hypothetical protein